MINELQKERDHFSAIVSLKKNYNTAFKSSKGENEQEGTASITNPKSIRGHSIVLQRTMRVLPRW